MPSEAFVEAQLVETLRTGVGHARTRLNALQATMDAVRLSAKAEMCRHYGAARG